MVEGDGNERRNRSKRMLGITLVLLGWLFCVGNVLVHLHSDRLLEGVDFRSVYSSSRCFITGCDPYNMSESMDEFLKQGGTPLEAGPPPNFGPFIEYFLGYPPSMLFYMLPFGVLRWPLAWIVYSAVMVLLYGLAAALTADLCADYSPIAANICLALFLMPAGRILNVGQPGLMAAALCCIGVWCLLKDRHLGWGVFCFSLSLVIKPHLGAFVLFYFLLATAEYRRQAWRIIGLTLVMCLPGLLLAWAAPASHHWVTEYSANLRGIATIGHPSSPGPDNLVASQIADLQTIVSLFRNDPSFYNPVVWGFCLLLLSAWVYAVVRIRPSKRKDIFCVAAIALFTILPVYHRVYDGRIFLLVFPALAVLWSANRRWGTVGMVMSLLLAFATSDFYMMHSLPGRPSLLWIHGNRLWTIVFERDAPIMILLLFLFYLAVLYRSPSGLSLSWKGEPLSSGAGAAV